MVERVLDLSRFVCSDELFPSRKHSVGPFEIDVVENDAVPDGRAIIRNERCVLLVTNLKGAKDE